MAHVWNTKKLVKYSTMLTDYITNDDTESTSLPADVTDDSCRLEFIEIVPRTRDTDDSRHRSAEFKQENLPAVKLELDDVCCIV